MAFTNALYYPLIDVPSEGWIKNALLYWDKVQTIVPGSIQQPYSTKTAREFQDEGLLLPLYVSPDMRVIERLEGEVFRYLESPEGVEVLRSTRYANDDRNFTWIHEDKMLLIIRSEVGRRLPSEKTLNEGNLSVAIG